MQDEDKSKQQLLEELAALRRKAAAREPSGADLQQTVAQQNLTAQILELLNQASREVDVVRDILLLLKAFTGMEAVGLRLKEREDYPYYESNGFPQDFIRKENFLCARDAAGNVLLDKEGLPVLECMCGNIIRGRVNPSLPFFSEGGSFWTNSTTDLLASTTEKDRQARTRNYCNIAGYESVALVPLRSHRGILGLLQLNDHRRNMFSSALIAFFERIAGNIGVALSRKRSEEEIERAAQQWQTTFDSMNEAVFLLDAKQRIRNCNRAACELTGKPREEMLGRCCWKVMHGTSGPVEDCPHLRVVKSGKRETLAMAHGNRQLEVSVDPVRNGNGSVTGSVHIISDVTERKRSEARITHLNAVLRGIRSVNQLITREKDRDRLIRQACDFLVEARGFHSVVIGLTEGSGRRVTMHAGAGRKLPALREFLSRGELPDCAGRALESREIVLRINPEQSCAGCPGALSPEGERDVLAVRLEQDRKVYGFLVACLPRGMGDDPEEQNLLNEAAGDIAFALRGMDLEAERDKSVSALKENAETLRIVADFAYDWEYWTDEDRNLLYMSPSCERITGYSVEEFKRDRDLMRRIVRPEDLPAVAAHEEETRRTDEPCGVDYRIVTKSGGEKWIGHRCVPVFCEGKRRGRRATNRDITERMVARKRLAETEAQLRQAQKLEAVGRLAGGVAHDFNNILTVINGYSEILLSKMKSDDPNRGPVEEIAGSGERAASLTHQLLAFSRKQVVKPVPVDLNAVVSNMGKMIGRLIGEDVEVANATEPGLGCIQADPGQIEQVIVNLVVNARDAMPQGGRLAIRTANIDLDDAHAGEGMGVKPGPYVVLALSDTGVGMDAETQSHLFEPFFTTKEPGKGTGLGLATVHGIIRQAGGCVRVTSEVGQGTTFKIYFPRVEKGAEAAQAERPPATRRRGTETVLLVEDSPPVRKLAGAILAGAGYTVLEAADGDAAMGILEGHPGPIHLLLTDSVLPVMGGGELALHATGRRKGIKVLFMSGYTDRVLQANGFAGKGGHFLSKPFTAESLLPKVREVLDSADQGP